MKNKLFNEIYMGKIDKQYLIDFETEVKEIYESGKITAPVHLSGGNE